MGCHARASRLLHVRSMGIGIKGPRPLLLLLQLWRRKVLRRRLEGRSIWVEALQREAKVTPVKLLYS